MGSGEDKTSSKSEKTTLSAQEPANIHLCPNWAAIQAYYGLGVPLPPPYLNSTATIGSLPHPNTWAPRQPLTPPYGVPCSPIYPHGVVYAHPAIPLVATPVSPELHSKSSHNTDQRSAKRLKTLEELSVQVGNDPVEADAVGSGHEVSRSAEHGNDASSNGSDDNIGACKSQRKNSSMGMLLTDSNVEVHKKAGFTPEGESNLPYRRAPESCTEKPVEALFERETGADYVASPAGAGLSFEALDERQLKRERRKQANRESARRSRLRKQAEIEELMMRYESLKVENLSLKSEIKQLSEECEKVRLENAALMERLGNPQLEQHREMVPGENGYKLALLNSTEELPMLRHPDSVAIGEERECKIPGNSSSDAKHQIIESKADAVATGC